MRVICPPCFADGRLPAGAAAADFVRYESQALTTYLGVFSPGGLGYNDGGYGALGGAGGGEEEREEWSEEEVLLLLEGIERFGDSWAEVAHHVGSKDRMQCVQYFVRLPIEDAFTRASPVLPPADTEAAVTAARAAAPAPAAATEPATAPDAAATATAAAATTVAPGSSAAVKNAGAVGGGGDETGVQAADSAPAAPEGSGGPAGLPGVDVAAVAPSEQPPASADLPGGGGVEILGAFEPIPFADTGNPVMAQVRGRVVFHGRAI